MHLYGPSFHFSAIQILNCFFSLQLAAHFHKSSTLGQKKVFQYLAGNVIGQAVNKEPFFIPASTRDPIQVQLPAIPGFHLWQGEH